MTAISASNSGSAPQSDPRGKTSRGVSVFGVPIGDFGLFASLLIALAMGFIGFFGVTFVSIFALLIYDHTGGGHHVTMDTSYKFIGLPAGIFVLIVSLAVMLGLWIHRKVTSH